MKLAEALLERADLQKRLAQLRERIDRSVRIQEGEQPPEQPGDLFAEMDRILEKLEQLINRINRTNLQTQLTSGRTIAEELTLREMTARRIALLRGAVSRATEPEPRFSRNEIRSTAVIDAVQLQKKIDSLSREHRETDVRIQQANWQYDLM